VKLHVVARSGAEQVPADWWNAFLGTAKQVLAGSGIAPQNVVAVCCSCQGEGTIPVDRDGQALSNAILWMDMRGAAHIRRHARGLINIAGYDALKLARWIRLTGGAPALSGKDPAGHMLFVRDEWPDIYRRTHKFLNVTDYLNLRLTGRMVATSDSILTSWVTDNRDASNIRYHEGLLRASGIDADKFPEIVRCTDIVGRLLPDVASELGLSAQTPVVAGAVDTTASAIGSGAVADGDPHLYIGTSSWIAAHVPFKKTDVTASIASVPCAVPGKYLMIAMQTSAGANLSYLRDRILFHHDELRGNDELLRDEQQPDVYKILDRIAARVPAGSRGLIYTPWLFGERSPVEDRTLRAGLFNLSLEHSREDIIRAFLEGVALNTRWMLQPVERFLGRRVEALTMVGGGAASDVWCQIFADVLNVRVRQLREPLQANALGAAYIAGVGLGLMRFDDVPARTRIRAEYVPQAANRAVLDRAFRSFTDIYKRMAPVYRRLNAGDSGS
jgi:xylulokinase